MSKLSKVKSVLEVLIAVLQVVLPFLNKKQEQTKLPEQTKPNDDDATRE